MRKKKEFDMEMEAYKHSINRDCKDLTDTQKEIIAALDAGDKAGVIAGIIKQSQEVVKDLTEHLNGLIDLNIGLSKKAPSIRSALLIYEIIREINQDSVETAMKVMLKRSMGFFDVHEETIVVDSDEKREALKKVQKIIAKMKKDAL